MQETHKSKKSSKYRCLKISNFSFVIDEKKEVHRLLRHTSFPATLRQRRCTHSMGTQGVSRPGYPSHRRTKQKDFGVLTSEGSRALMRLFSSPYPHTRLKLFLSKLRKLLSSLFSHPHNCLSQLLPRGNHSPVVVSVTFRHGDFPPQDKNKALADKSSNCLILLMALLF